VRKPWRREHDVSRLTQVALPSSRLFAVGASEAPKAVILSAAGDVLFLLAFGSATKEAQQAPQPRFEGAGFPQIETQLQTLANPNLYFAPGYLVPPFSVRPPNLPMMPVRIHYPP
jgi:hypothetical protein